MLESLSSVLHAGLITGTIILFAAIGEIIAERSGVMNLGVEGMMLIGAIAGMSSAFLTGSVWVGLLMAVASGAMLSLVHAVVSIHLQANQVISGLALTFLGAGLALVVGAGFGDKTPPVVPKFDIPGLAEIPFVGPLFFRDHSLFVYLGYALAPAAWFYIYRTHLGMNLRSVGENPEAAQAMGVDVYRTRYLHVLIGGCLAGLAGATITLAVAPGWFGDLTTGGFGWIAIALVIFAQWNPLRALAGAYLFGTIERSLLDLQGVATILGMTNPLFLNPNYLFFLKMTPYLLTILALVVASPALMRKRLGVPAALGIPYTRG